jgi:hypothetical protein
MVDVLRLITIDTSIDEVLRAQFTDARAIRFLHPPHCFLATNPLARVLGDAIAFQKTYSGETAETVKPRLRNRQTARLLSISGDSVFLSVNRPYKGQHCI